MYIRDARGFLCVCVWFVLHFRNESAPNFLFRRAFPFRYCRRPSFSLHFFPNSYILEFKCVCLIRFSYINSTVFLKNLLSPLRRAWLWRKKDLVWLPQKLKHLWPTPTRSLQVSISLCLRSDQNFQRVSNSPYSEFIIYFLSSFISLLSISVSLFWSLGASLSSLRLMLVWLITHYCYNYHHNWYYEW